MRTGIMSATPRVVSRRTTTVDGVTTSLSDDACIVNSPPAVPIASTRPADIQWIALTRSSEIVKVSALSSPTVPSACDGAKFS